jgi:hypothetical protein
LYGDGAAGDRDSNVEGGLDFFNRMPREHEPVSPADALMGFLDDVLITSVEQGQSIVETTGYPSQEFDPWTGAYADGIDPNNPGTINTTYKSGADGILDWVIIEVSSGVDIKSDTQKDALDFQPT